MHKKFEEEQFHEKKDDDLQQKIQASTEQNQQFKEIYYHLRPDYKKLYLPPNPVSLKSSDYVHKIAKKLENRFNNPTAKVQDLTKHKKDKSPFNPYKHLESETISVQEATE